MNHVIDDSHHNYSLTFLMSTIKNNKNTKNHESETGQNPSTKVTPTYRVYIGGAIQPEPEVHEPPLTENEGRGAFHAP